MSGPCAVSSPTGLSPGDHVCWPFHHHEDLVAGARAYLAEGLARDERVAYVSDRPPGELRHDLDGLPDLDEHLERGRLLLVPFGTLPATNPSVRPSAELPVLAAMSAEALEAGYRSLRMFAHGSVRAQHPAQRAEHVRYEHLIDRFCLTHLVTMLCAYDASLLGDAAVSELACVHRVGRGELSPFRLSADPQADVALAGSVDTLSAIHLVTALERIGVPVPGEILRVDTSALEFVDHRTLLALDQYAARRLATVVLQSTPSILRVPETRLTSLDLLLRS
ncbi:MAG TPA: MEDS domain-containing protein [Propionibacteriaceae bacterium]|nr:MEDS domain-containing protein [Propionibacteriaceae bacterium]